MADGQDLAGIARDSCPYCGERVKVSVLALLPSRNKTLVKCAACGQKSQIAGRTRIGGGVAGMLGSGIAVALTVRTSETLCFAMATLAYLVVGYLVSRLMLRLDPPELAD
jgi:hypothetical protein